MAQQVAVDPASVTGEAQDDGTIGLTTDLAYKRVGIVNVVFYGAPGQPGWVLVDTGVIGTTGMIRKAAAERFGTERPAAIVMTHGHFDHIGGLVELSREWDVPVYAHPLELPYLNGGASYPPADPGVGGGLMALLSPLFPTRPVDVGERLQPLPADGSVPGMAGWRWIHTPGHSVGHVSLWREADRAMIVGDAFVTTAPESAYAAAVAEPELHGPPKYFTHDWQAAARSVRELATLQPDLAVTGHGRAMQGEGLRSGLDRLAAEFETVAVPKDGQFVADPQRVADGSAYRT